ncbi:MAG: site-2 protease family protein [Kofleriaceae bacterium]
MDFSPEQIRWIFTAIFVLVASVALHEFGHAIVAHRLGDPTPSRQGRVTLNPVAHTDIIGTLLLPLMSLIYGGGVMGWGKPVQTQPTRYTRRWSMGTGQMLVALAGPMMNILLAVVVGVVHCVLLLRGVIDPGHPVSEALAFAVILNFTLFFFNLLPTPPLDGGYVIARFVPYRHRATFDKIAVYGPFILMAFIMISPLSKVFTVPARFLAGHLYGLFGFGY